MNNKISLPGFNAASLIHAGSSFTNDHPGKSDLWRKENTIVMQMRMGHLGCYMNCYGSTDPFCYDQCDMDNGGEPGGGGPSEPYCRPSCGDCVPDSSSSTGGTRWCIDSRCNDHQKNCHVRNRNLVFN